MTRVFTLLTGAHVIVVSQWSLRQRANVAGKFQILGKVDKIGSKEAIRITNHPGFEGGV